MCTTILIMRPCILGQQLDHMCQGISAGPRQPPSPPSAMRPAATLEQLQPDVLMASVLSFTDSGSFHTPDTPHSDGHTAFTDACSGHNTPSFASSRGGPPAALTHNRSSGPTFPSQHHPPDQDPHGPHGRSQLAQIPWEIHEARGSSHGSGGPCRSRGSEPTSRQASPRTPQGSAPSEPRYPQQSPVTSLDSAGAMAARSLLYDSAGHAVLQGDLRGQAQLSVADPAHEADMSGLRESQPTHALLAADSVSVLQQDHPEALARLQAFQQASHPISRYGDMYRTAPYAELQQSSPPTSQQSNPHQRLQQVRDQDGARSDDLRGSSGTDADDKSGWHPDGDSEVGTPGPCMSPDSSRWLSSQGQLSPAGAHALGPSGWAVVADDSPPASRQSSATWQQQGQPEVADDSPAASRQSSAIWQQQGQPEVADDSPAASRQSSATWQRQGRPGFVAGLVGSWERRASGAEYVQPPGLHPGRCITLLTENGVLWWAVRHCAKNKG